MNALDQFRLEHARAAAADAVVEALRALCDVLTGDELAGADLHDQIARCVESGCDALDGYDHPTMPAAPATQPTGALVATLPPPVRLCAFTDKPIDVCGCTTCRARRGDVEEPEQERGARCEPDDPEVEGRGEPPTKLCKTCGHALPDTDEHFASNRNGRIGHCRSCMSRKQKNAQRKRAAAQKAADGPDGADGPIVIDAAPLDTTPVHRENNRKLTPAEREAPKGRPKASKGRRFKAHDKHPDAMVYKTCTGCGLDRALLCFAKTDTGRRAECRDCVPEAAR